MPRPKTGDPLIRVPAQGALVSSGEVVACTLSGTAGADSSTEDICQIQDWNISVTEDRRHDSGCLYQQSGRDSVQRFSIIHKEPMDVVPGEEHPHISSVPTWCIEPGSKQGIEVHEARSDWSLDHTMFLKINRLYRLLKVDLLASRLTNQCQHYFSWRPGPFAEATDTFLQYWTMMNSFANTPWNLLPKRPNIVSIPIMPQLAVWTISGKALAIKACQDKLLISSLTLGDQESVNYMTHFSADGIAGVLGGVQMPIQDLSAISLVHEKEDGVSVSQHPIITSLIRGIFDIIPSSSNTWDVQLVLNFLQSQGKSETLPLKMLTLKSVFLTRPSQSADLSQLDTSRIRSAGNGASFLPSALAKQSRQGKPIETFPSFLQNSILCPVETISVQRQN
uniref:Uncharacterized protein n=1 Tax=Amphimedon queenslandica TaxID=400682 RepID=A0A1X7VT19_AMPQE